MSFMAAENVRSTHSACQAQFAGRRGKSDGAVRDTHMTAADPHAPSRAPTFMKQWRVYKKLTQEQVAERVDLDRTTYLRIESGKLPYNQDFLEKLALAFGCDAADILSIDPLKPDPPKLIYQRLKAAPPELQSQALAILEALLKGAA